jgi:hypothetical protein
MPAGELEPIGRSGPALAEVAAELNEIFERAGVGQAASISALRRRDGNGSAMTLLAAAVATSLLGFGAGALVIRMHSPRDLVASRIAAVTQPSPQPSVSPPIALAQAALAPATDTAPVAKAVAASPKTLHRAARLRDHSRPELATLGEPTAAEDKPPIRLGVPSLAARPASCEQDADGEECRQAVVQADRHLRTVYQGAFERGVSRQVLVDYRDRWARLRVRNNEDPVRLIESYDSLAYDLRREAGDDQEEGPRPKSRSGLSALADLLLPWR